MNDNLFADIPVYDDTKREFKPTKFLKIIPGYPVRIRILSESAYRVSKHYLPKQRVSLVCLEDECPICENNKILANANPDTPYNEVSGIIGRQNRYLVNVLNRTKVKISATGKVVYAGSDGKFPVQHPESGEDLSTIKSTALNTVEVLERGSTLFGQLNGIHDTIRNEEGERIGLTNYDIILTATGKGRQMTVSAVAQPQLNDVVEVKEEEIYNLEKVPMKMSAGEIVKLLNGISLQDIFEARKVSKDTKELEIVASDVAEDVEDSIERLFDGLEED